MLKGTNQELCSSNNLKTQMQEGDSLDAFLTKIKDFKEQLLNINEMISDKQIVSKVLAALPDSWEGFAFLQEVKRLSALMR